jgi:small subunit ribosomal protein S1
VLADDKVENPEDVVKVGDEVDVKILRVDIEDRKIGLSRRLDAPIEEDGSGTQGAGGGEKAAKQELKGGMGGEAGPLFSFGSEKAKTEEKVEEASEEPKAEEAVE